MEKAALIIISFILFGLGSGVSAIAVCMAIKIFREAGLM
jgi:hypothetical protein